MERERKSQVFFAVTDAYKVVRAMGLETQEPGCWWVPSLGFSMWVGIHLFDTEVDARSRARLNWEADGEKHKALEPKEVPE